MSIHGWSDCQHNTATPLAASLIAKHHMKDARAAFVLLNVRAAQE